MHHYLLFALAGFISLGMINPVNSQQTPSKETPLESQDLNEQDRRSIEQVIASYESAFNSQNIETLVSHWSNTRRLFQPNQRQEDNGAGSDAQAI